MLSHGGVNYSQQLRVQTDVGNVNLAMAQYHASRPRSRAAVRRKHPNATVSQWARLYAEYNL